MPYIGPSISAVIRIDVGEDRRLRGSEILHATGTVPASFNLLGKVEEALTVRFASRKRHRVIVFLVVELGEGRLALGESLVVRPLCCCGYTICI